MEVTINPFRELEGRRFTPCPTLLEAPDLPEHLRPLAGLLTVECRIEGVRRLSGLGCLHYQASLIHYRWSKRGPRLNPRYRFCMECPHRLSDADYRAALRAKMKRLRRLRTAAAEKEA